MFTLLFVVFLVAGVLIRMWLGARQMRHVVRNRNTVPAEFAGRIGAISHERAADYTVARVRLKMWSLLFDSAVLVGLTLLGGLEWINTWLGSLIDNDFGRQLALLGVVAGLLGLLGLPFSIYRQFGLEARFGFNRMSFGLFMGDAIKGLILSVALGLPLIAAILWLMRSAGTAWWIWAWAVWAGFNLVVMLVYPRFIAPLFNKFSPLDDPALAGRIQALAKRCGFALDGLFVMDGSRRSAHGNAYFTGIGRAKRIVFFDTLLAKLNADEIEAVLAHELGHFSHKHIFKRLVLSFGMALAVFALLGWVSQQVWFYEQLGVSPSLTGGNQGMALLLFFLVSPVFMFFLTPLASWWSRRHEFEADRYAADHADPNHLVSALVKLYDDNAATLTPDPVHSAFYDSHPPATIRIGRLIAAGASLPNANAPQAYPA